MSDSAQQQRSQTELLDSERTQLAELGKMKRISHHTRSLVDDVKSWVDLKMTLTQMEIEEKVDEKVNQALTGAVVGVLALLAITFGLVAAALGIGEWLGHPAWGFLVIMGILLVVTFVLWSRKPKMVDISSKSDQT